METKPMCSMEPNIFGPKAGQMKTRQAKIFRSVSFALGIRVLFKYRYRSLHKHVYLASKCLEKLNAKIFYFKNVCG